MAPFGIQQTLALSETSRKLCQFLIPPGLHTDLTQACGLLTVTVVIETHHTNLQI